jgi:hypothetical protein
VQRREEGAPSLQRGAPQHLEREGGEARGRRRRRPQAGEEGRHALVVGRPLARSLAPARVSPLLSVVAVEQEVGGAAAPWEEMGGGRGG